MENVAARIDSYSVKKFVDIKKLGFEFSKWELSLGYMSGLHTVQYEKC